MADQPYWRPCSDLAPANETVLLVDLSTGRRDAVALGYCSDTGNWFQESDGDSWRIVDLECRYWHPIPPLPPVEQVPPRVVCPTCEGAGPYQLWGHTVVCGNCKGTGLAP